MVEAPAGKVIAEEFIKIGCFVDGAQAEIVPGADVADIPPEVALFVGAAGIARYVFRHETDFRIGRGKV